MTFSPEEQRAAYEREKARLAEVVTRDPNAPKRARVIEILMVEDNEPDILLTQKALKAAHVANQISIVRDGEAAIQCLMGAGEYKDAPRPDLIFLDLNLPKRDGREVLAFIKAHPDLKRIPVVILTSSKADADIVESYNLHANCFVVKPLTLDAFLKVVSDVGDFWLAIVSLPLL
jgi:CheY-like chemotaxis protein